jgi:hypothetical protein
MINREQFIYAAEKEGFTWEFADAKLDAYLDSRGTDANPTLFVRWLLRETEIGTL